MTISKPLKNLSGIRLKNKIACGEIGEGEREEERERVRKREREREKERERKRKRERKPGKR